ncbi:LytTR family DNA-binding domain-containing protein [Dechloromonas sp. ZY10]|uniref:LytR/AlgR family response regulator transcription factor n=1 Tax=Dechloromonas aquae TaxID=2664436 RepID=UPI00352835A8
MSAPVPLNLLLVDDEAPARERLRLLLGDMAGQLPNRVVGEAANGREALAWLNACAATGETVDGVLADIRMPGMDGIELASHLALLPQPPAVIFTTAYDNYAVQAFDLAAVDYLLKPVRAQRLLTALQKLPARLAPTELRQLAATLGQNWRGGGRSHLSCHERGRLLLIPVDEILYLRAEQKYVTARTLERDYLLDESLAQLEAEFVERFLRLHRAVLVAPGAVAGFEKAAGDDAEAYGWALLRGVPEKLPVSRRLWSAVRQALA